jgi:dTDP-4-amino-4,6-dideoxygalactose transaminase
MYQGGYVCVSFHWNKILGIQQGGAILHDDAAADLWFRRARFDGRTEGVPPKEDQFKQIGHHCYMSPEIAAEGLVRLSHLPKHNPDMPNDDYPDLSLIDWESLK